MAILKLYLGWASALVSVSRLGALQGVPLQG